MEIAVINKGKKRKKTTKRRKTTAKRTTKRRAKRAAPKRRRTRRNPAKKRARRRTVKGARLNPIEGDLVKTAKDVGVITLGALAAFVMADYAGKKINYVAEHPSWAKPVSMAAGGLVIPQVLKGPNKALATKLSYGMLISAALYAVLPWVAEKLPGMPLMDAGLPLPTGDVSGYYNSMGQYVPAMGPGDMGDHMGAYVEARRGDWMAPGMGAYLPVDDGSVGAYYAEELGDGTSQY